MNRIILIIITGLFSQFATSQQALSEKYNLMPWPQEIQENNSKFNINESLTITILGNDSEGRVQKASTKFLRRLADRTGVFIDTGFPIENKNAAIKIDFQSVSDLTIHQDESYTLHIKSDEVLIQAKTDVGALRALETLLQLTTHTNLGNYFPGVTIQDTPRFVWRGLMIDVARHFQPVAVIKRNLDAMASVKLNVFHWHLTDDQGFRVASKTYPKLQELASDGLYYTHAQIKDVVQYASDLGIRVIPEFDVPGHASALLTAYPELGSKDNYTYSIERYAGVFDPTLNPIKEETYVFLENLFTEIAPLFPDEYFHIGGDENEGKHWTENKEIEKFKKKHQLKTNHDLQTFFNIRLEKILKKLDKKLMGWDEIMTPTMPTTAVIHSWRGTNEGLKSSTLIEAAKKGYNTVLSNGYYIDRMLSVQHHYSVDPIADAVLTKEERKRILGAETTMWSELVTPLTIDSRIWPRTAAIAERYWSAKEITDIDNMLHRLEKVSLHLEELGITHIRNKDVILRNMTKGKDISSLITLSNICEPLKVYSRNKGGTEYKSFSPFTLFADACVVDAKDAVVFNKNTTQFLEDNNSNTSSKIKEYLMKWTENHEAFMQISKNPILQSLVPLSKNLAEVSQLLHTSFQTKKITEAEFDQCKNYIKQLKEPFADTEVVIVDALQKLLLYCKAKYLVK
ncbi:family 20 glycosylhydrolase [uncultured Kordia sp.]|uniref:beta-N-acetylhexosaminidase n=1 Tax=uncultured Kordia sp. TaxID=507699 RepID=UPI0026216842|nr:family 20 glycosylhydrolase [uncultured Kordia sp.]